MFWALVFASLAHGFYLSAWAPSKIHVGDSVELWFNKVFSEKTQLNFAYIDLAFTCQPRGSRLSYDALNFGEVFRGDRTVKSGHRFKATEDIKCASLCDPISLSTESLSKFRQFIDEDYRVEWILDDLPAGVEDQSDVRKLEPGFHLGFKDADSGKHYAFNHLDIVITYNTVTTDKNGGQEYFLIVGFKVVPRSIGWGDEPCSQKMKDKFQVLSDNMDKISYTYSVKWQEDLQGSWARRWEVYMDSSNAQIHWYSIINSLMLLVVLTVIVAFIMIATLRRDIANYNSTDEEGLQDDVVGWKMIHGDVFRNPQGLKILAPLVGSGVQIFSSSFFTILFGVFGILNPSYRGGMLQYALFFWAFAGVFAGYFSARLQKAFSSSKSGPSWQTNAFWTATMFPLFLFTTLCVVNTFNWAVHSSNALPAGTFVALLAVWLLISLPLVMVGAYFGQKKQAIEHPVRTNQIPRQIPAQPVYFRLLPTLALGGVVPFTVVFMELYFILKSMWQDQYYYMYGFLFLSFVLLIITCVEVTIMMIYFQLCSEDYRWHWRSFLVSSSSTWYILVFALGQYISRQEMHVGFMASVLFISKLLIGTAVYFVCTGMIGFWMSYWFLRRIYGAIKID